MTPTFAHKIVHSSAVYYQNLIIIHECSKKLLKMKNSKSFFLTPSTCTVWRLLITVQSHDLLISPATPKESPKMPDTPNFGTSRWPEIPLSIQISMCLIGMWRSYHHRDQPQAVLTNEELHEEDS